MDNTFRIADLPDNAEVHVMVISGHIVYQGIYGIRLSKGSPLRELLEAQERFQDKLG